MNAATRVMICDVGPRDGLQNQSRLVPAADKVRIVNALSASGLRRIEVTSFVSPRAIPQLADAEQVMHEIERRPGVQYVVLVPNLRGAERALSCAPDELNVVMSVSETHNRANLRMTREESFAALSGVAAVADKRGVPVNVSLSCSFGCPFEGDVPVESIVEWIARFTAQGVGAYTICDTTGMAYPRQVRQIMAHLRDRFPRHVFTLHFHNTRGLGVANVLAAAADGCDRFDASLGGLGGCPYAPGATGNVCTEEVVHALHLEGYETGVNLEALIAAAQGLPSIIGEDIPSQIARAGPRTRLYSVDEVRNQR